ncbi:MAG: ribosomal RNA small subunit methyltransferase A [Acidobacteriota bacterium]|nr:ribosomal RNA small subunit methyltransferase A [Acidobacteriota bacterium]
MPRSKRDTGSGGARTASAPPAHRPRRRFGQHFLEPAWVARLVAALDAQADDTFIEIGPGKGALTAPLATRAGRVVAVEIDRDLAAHLSAQALPGVAVVCADVLRIDLAALVAEEAARSGGRVRIVGNLPYNISSPILFRLLALAAGGAPVHDATLMLQREVADRLAARPGSRDYGRLTIHTALYADVTRLFVLPPGAFRPAPAVQSAVVRLSFHPAAAPVGDPEGFDGLLRQIFGLRRKTLANALKPLTAARGLSATACLASAGLDGRRRPETLDLAELARLHTALVSPKP